MIAKARWLALLHLSSLALCSAGFCFSDGESGFRVRPYLQNPSATEMTLIWFSEDDSPGFVTYVEEGSSASKSLSSVPVPAEALAYSDWENQTFLNGEAPAPPYRHRVRLKELTPNTTYVYTVQQGESQFSAHFRTAPGPQNAIRFVVYADCETEPESTGKQAKWVAPVSGKARTYLLDQTVGYANNLKVIKARQPDFVAIAGDLVESGGEQRDWDEFWRHLTGAEQAAGIASEIPFFAAPGNHEYYEGPRLDGYRQPGSERAVARFRTYLESPANLSPVPEHEGRYFRVDYGPVTLLFLDVTNGTPGGSINDTNFFLLGERDQSGGHSPGFNPGSEQWSWLETELEASRNHSAFTFVVFHHSPYSSGPHGWPPGVGDGLDKQSGVPVRRLTQLFMRYGVDAVFSGHDEIWERSEVTGREIAADGRMGFETHTIHFYDVGIGGDGLRGPEAGLSNPYQKYLAHRDSPEVWQDGVLLDGGKHYGHLEVNIVPLPDSTWQAVCEPVYVFPVFDSDSTLSGFERRVYDDVVTLVSDR